MKVIEEAGGEARLAGGCVRDRQLGLEPKDYDIATTLKPAQILSILGQKVKVVPTGIEHGTITVVMPCGPIEVTSLRRDVETDGRRAVVEFGESFEEDSARRDFTLNALYEDREGRVYDYHDGLLDLKANRLRFVGVPKERIQEDYLRIVRFYRFWARFGFEPDPLALPVLAELKDGLKQVSRERLTSEWLKITEGDHAAVVIEAMQQQGVLPLLVGGRVRDPLVLANPFAKGGEAYGWFYFCGVLPADLSKEEFLRLARTLRLSNRLAKKVQVMAGLGFRWPSPTLDDGSLMEFIDHIEASGGEGGLKDFLTAWRVLFSKEVNLWQRLEQLEQSLGALRRKPPPLSGHQLQKEFSLTGHDIGETLNQLKRAFRNGEFQDSNGARAYCKKLLS